MITTTLSLHTNGAVTLPKEWREQFPTKHYMAMETQEGLLIKPIMDIDYYERSDGSFGLRFPHGIDAGELSEKMHEALADMKKAKKKKSPHIKHG